MAPRQLICYSGEGIKKSSSDVQKIMTLGGGVGVLEAAEGVYLNRGELMPDYGVKTRSVSVRESVKR